MSKAFTADDASESPLVVPARAPLPPGTANYVTARGLAALHEELRGLEVDRARLLASTSGDPDRPRGLQVVGARLAALEDRVSSAVLVHPSSQTRHEVRFGASVTLRDVAGEERTFQIVGVDEADAAHGRLAFVAPLARALLGKRVGDVVVVRTPREQGELEVVRIHQEGGPAGEKLHDVP